MTWWAGVAAFIAPCTLVLVPFFLLFLVGAMASQRQENLRRSPAPTAARWFALGFMLAFVIVWSFPNAAETVVRWSRLTERAGGTLVILHGLWLVGVLATVNRAFRRPRINLIRPLALGVGATFAAGWTPCVGATLSRILGMTGGADGGYASVLLSVYAFGLMTPFILLGWLSPFPARWLEKERRVRLARPIVGAGLVIVGLTVLTGNLRELTAYLYALAPGFGL